MFYHGPPSKEFTQEQQQIQLFVKDFLVNYFFREQTDEKILHLKKELLGGAFFEFSINIKDFLKSELPTSEFLFDFAKMLDYTNNELMPEIAKSAKISQKTIAYIASSKNSCMSWRCLLVNEKTSKEHALMMMKTDSDYGCQVVAESRFVGDVLEVFQKEINIENITRLLKGSTVKKGERRPRVLNLKELKEARLHELGEILGSLLSNPRTPVNFLVDCIPVIEQLYNAQFLKFYDGSSNSCRGGYVTLAKLLENPNLPKETLDALFLCTNERERCMSRVQAHPNYYKQNAEAPVH